MFLMSGPCVCAVNNIPGIEEVNMIKDDGTVIHFNNPKVQASLAANTFAVTGHAENKRKLSTQAYTQSLYLLAAFSFSYQMAPQTKKIGWIQNFGAGVFGFIGRIVGTALALA